MLASTRKALTGAIAFFCTAVAWASAPPVVTADSAVILDAESGKVLWGKDMETGRFPASTTKIMTALLLIERCRPEEVIIAPPGVDKVEGASLHLVPGEQLTAGQMLYAILLRSANDGCIAVADHISGSVPAFCQLMNQRAAELGCQNTHFDNPNGLNDDKHTISAHDLGLIAREAMTYPEFRAVVGIRRHEIVRSVNTQDRFLCSKNKYLSIDPTADGIKTGWTREAGQCYVGSATRNGYRVITVMLHGTDWKKDNAEMLDWAFQNHDRRVVAQNGEPLAEIHVAGGTESLVPATVAADVHHIYAKDSPCEASMTFEQTPGLKAPIQKGQPVGDVILTDKDGWTEKVPLVAATSMPKASMAMGAGFFALFLLLGVCGSGAYIIKRRISRLKYAKKLFRQKAKVRAQRIF
jgi:D-alanyl-D-alanine carboxypeptidase (penicillin-binding protein 5/6)